MIAGRLQADEPDWYRNLHDVKMLAEGRRRATVRRSACRDCRYQTCPTGRDAIEYIMEPSFAMVNLIRTSHLSISDAYQVVSQLLHCVCSRTGLCSLSVVSDQDGLFCQADAYPFFPLLHPHQRPLSTARDRSLRAFDVSVPSCRRDSYRPPLM